MSNLRYGLKEVANVIFFDIATGKPALLFDTLKVSTIENASESTDATGGQGAGKLMSWDYGRTATLNMTDALLSDASMAMLAGTTVKNTDVKIVGRERLTVDGSTAPKVTLAQTPDAGSVTVFKVVNGVMDEEIIITAGDVVDKDITLTTATAGDQVMAFYTYTKADGASSITFSSKSFPATYRVVGDTIVRGEDGIDRAVQFVIPRAKLQTAFTLTMDAENVSTFDFNLDVLVDTSSAELKLYDIIRY